MFILPVSGTRVAFLEGSGMDELFLAEGHPDLIAFRIDVARRFAPPQDQGTDWDDLPYADIDAALLALHRHLYGDRLSTEICCHACASRGDVSFSVASYLADNRPSTPRGLQHDADGTWTWRDVRFRIPSVRDVRDHFSRDGSIEAAADGIAQRCAPGASPAALTRVGALLDTIAPPLARTVKGTCPECAAPVHGWLDPGAVVLAELQAKARAVFEHVHLLASSYRWSEQAILAMPTRRRRLYAAYIEEAKA